ncbi:carbohydrate ABC transporter substrate-binding protein [Paenibacillaceae bacterium]|nr:carbohydrate ABC transporter substrate-binding protein [Paenibacillaceae bacterium]
MLSVFMLAAFVLGGCMKLNKEEDTTIRVVHYSEDSFAQRYGGFTAKYPHIKVEVISMQKYMNPDNDWNDEYDQVLAQHPDVLLLFPDKYESLAQQGELYDLEVNLQEDGFDLDNMLPSVIEMLKWKGDGRLYGLAPSFYSQALFYNRELFDLKGIPYPTDQMSWEEIFQLASRFSPLEDEKPVYGFYDETMERNHQIFHLIRDIGLTKQLNYVDTVSSKISINSESWAQVFHLVIGAMQSRALNNPLSNDQHANTGAIPGEHAFLDGKAAMSISGYYFIQNLQQSRQVKEWDIVTVPVDEQQRDASTRFGLSEIYAVHANSSQKAAAAKLVQYINSDDAARTASKLSADISSRVRFSEESAGRTLEAFYKLNLTNYSDTALSALPREFHQAFSLLVSDQVRAVLNKEKSLEEALQFIEDQGQQLLYESLNN